MDIMTKAVVGDSCRFRSFTQFEIKTRKGVDILSRIKYNIGVTKRKRGEIMSPKTGRPKADNPKDIRYSVRLDVKTEEKLQEYCKKHNITKGEAIRQGIHLLLAEKK